MWGPSILSVRKTLDNIAMPIVTMLRKGWFDDAVGLVEGFEIFRQLMEYGSLLPILLDPTRVLIFGTQTV